MYIYLIRHATQESILCNDNTSLSKEGVKQAEAIGKRLCNYGIDAIFSSDLLRAKETAEIINNCFKADSNAQVCPHFIRPGLQEADFGILTGHTDDDIAVTYRDFMESRYHTTKDWRYPGGENGEDVWTRFSPVFSEILSSGYQKVAVVTHGGAIRCALSHLFGRGFYERLVFGKKFARGSISELYYDEARDFLSLERFNDGAHLEGISYKKNENSFPSGIFFQHPVKAEKDVTIVLGSKSPRRKELLTQIGIPFIQMTSDEDEIITSQIPEEVVKELSAQKAENVARQLIKTLSEPSGASSLLPDTDYYLVLGADTIVISPDEKILGKPKDEKEAFSMLSSLSGKAHAVCSGVSFCLVDKKNKTSSAPVSFAEKTLVFVAAMTEQEIHSYIATKDPMDKAGAYGIQGSFGQYIKKIEGDYYNVVGLPLHKTADCLKSLGLVW